MKRKLLLILCLLGIFTVKAQEPKNIPSLLDITEMSEATSKNYSASSDKKKKKIKNIRKHKFTKEIRKINFADVSKITTDQSKGYFRMDIPRSKKGGKYKNVLIVPREIETQENGDYYYFGDLVHGKNTRGNIVLIKKEGEHYGTIQIGKRDFQIMNIGKDNQILIEKTASTKTSCATPEKGSSSSKKITKNSLSNKASCTKKVRVLVLYTNKANAVSNPSSVASAGIHLFNSAKNSSRVYNSDLVMELAGVRALPSFVETNSVVKDFNKAVDFSDIRVLRNQYRADLVVVLTNGNYGATLGYAALFDYGNPNKGHVALVDANSNSWVFPHETGHLMGCQHDVISTQAPNVPASSKAHNWYYKKGWFNVHKWQKSIVAGGGAKGYFVSRFSNPAVKYESRSQGYTGRSDRNNSLQLKNSACTVSNYIASEPDPVLGVGISGSSYGTIGKSLTLTASVSNCSSRTYKWERSSNGYSYYNAGSASTLSIRPYSTDNIYVRLTVTCSNGQSKTAFRTIYISGSGGPQQKSSIISDSLVVEVEPLENLNIAYSNVIVNYPNPATNVLHLESGFADTKKVKIYLYDIVNGGKNKKIYQGNLDSSNPLDLNIGNFNQGLYRLDIYENGTLIFRTRQLIAR